ncbi:PIH1 domain [Trinorchestia longiramus]|nr:PIH1 domain [Trinorchestia longiramus]
MNKQKQNSSATLLDVDESILTNRLLLQDDGKTFGRQELSQLLPDSTETSAITITPEPGICVKTKLLSGSGSKVFVNVCTCSKVPLPEDLTDDELLEILNSDEPSNFRIPMSIGALHEEKDKSGNACSAYDVVVNPEFLIKVKDNLLFMNFFVIATFEALEAKFSLELDKNGWTVLKNKVYLGTLGNQLVRTSVPLVQELSGLRPTPKSSDSSSSASLLTEVSSRPLVPNTTDDSKTKSDKRRLLPGRSSGIEDTLPKHERLLTPVDTKKLSSNQKTRPNFTLERLLSDNVVGPKEMIGIAARVQLPGQVKGGDVTVLVGEDSLVLESISFFLELPLPCPVLPHQACAFFIKEKQEMLVRAPLLTAV